MKTRTVGVIVGRFQVDELTPGHVALIDHVRRCNDEVCVLVGTAAKPDSKNPLPYRCVEQMIRTTYPDIYFVHPLLDTPGEDLQWSLQLDRFLQLLFPQSDIKLYGGRDSFKQHYHGRYKPVVEFTGFDQSVSGTRIRHEIVNGDTVDSPAFRAGIIYARGNDVSSQHAASDRQLQGVPLEASQAGNNLHL